MTSDGRLDDTTYDLGNEQKLTLRKWHKMVD